jgi:hypothetical protein
MIDIRIEENHDERARYGEELEVADPTKIWFRQATNSR